MKRKCFVIMPYGEKSDSNGVKIDFDDLYEFLIKGAVEDLKIESVRCDKADDSRMIHREMIEQIYEADVAVVDITTENANVFYELGVRHALRKYVTVVIQRVGDGIPFNLKGLNVISYDPSKVMTLVAAREKIRNAIQAGLQSGKNDSLVHESLELRISQQKKEIENPQRFSYQLRQKSDKRIYLDTGPIEHVKDVDVWVNSENTDMQMARFFESSISGIIRYLGAVKDDFGRVTKDTIADELRGRNRKQQRSAPAHVIRTGPGTLADTHGVKCILHAATVQGTPGHGYAPVPGFASGVSRALEMADAGHFASIVFPIFCSGTARGDVAENFRLMLTKAIKHLETSTGTIERVHFLAWSADEVRACLDVLDRQSGALEERPSA